MKYYREVIVKQAQAWIGKNEVDGSFKEIIDIYNSHKPRARGYKLKYTDAWCSGFASAVAIKCGYTAIIPTEVGCEKHIKRFKKLNRWVESDSYKPQAGDYIFYDWEDSGKGENTGRANHVGIVEKVVGNNISVIEGNYNEKVQRRIIEVNARYIRGYGIPAYTEEGASFSVGDRVKLKAEAVYYNGKTIPKWVKKKTLYVREINKDRVVISWLKVGAITGAVNIKYLEKV